MWISDFLQNDLTGPFGEVIDGAAANIEETLGGVGGVGEGEVE